MLQPPELTPVTLQVMLECLFQLDLAYLEAHPQTPQLYHSGVRYRREKQGRERWAAVPHVLRLGYGDCEDLATWRAAELRKRGERATPISSHKITRNGGVLYHIRVRRGDGSIEDPSRILGMGTT